MNHAQRLYFVLASGLFQAFTASAQAPAAAVSAASAPARSASAPVRPASAAASGPQRLDQINVQGRAESERRQSTASRIVISRDELLKQGDTSVAEALRRVPGVTIGGIPGRGGPIRMRGLGGGFTRILLNGEPLPRGFDLDSLSPEVVERIEVMRSATAEFSSQAVAGAINIVTRVPVSRDVREITLGGSLENGQFSPQLGGRLSSNIGSMSYTINAQVNGNRFIRPSQSGENATSAAGAATLERLSNREQRERQESINLAPRFQWTLGPGEFIALEPFVFANQSKNSYRDNTRSFKGAAATYPQIAADWETEFSTGRLNLSYNRPMGDGGRLEASVGVSRNRFYGEFNTDGFDALGGLSLDRYIDTLSTANGYSTRGKITIPYIEKHDASFGWEINGYTAEETRTTRERSFNPAIPAQNLDEDYGTKSQQLAFYAQDEWKMSDKFSLYSGLRWEGITIKTSTQGNALLNPAYKNESKVLSPSLQAQYKFGQNNRDQLRFALSRTYRAPNPFQLSPRRFVSTNNSQTSPDRAGNPDLRPELAWGLDIGFERYLDSGGVLGANIFYRSIDDVFRNDTSLLAGRWVSQPINKGKASTLGLEVEAKFGIQAFDKDLPKIDLRANASVYSSKVNSIPGPNNRLEQQAPATLNLGADWSVKGLPLTVGGNLNVTTAGEARTADNQIVYGSVKRGLDVYADYRFTATTRLRVSAANMLAQENLSATTFFDPLGGQTVQYTLTPTKPVLRFTLTHRFM